jgi:TPR repeat protein
MAGFQQGNGLQQVRGDVQMHIRILHAAAIAVGLSATGLVLSSADSARADNLVDQPLDQIKLMADAGRADAQRELGIRYGQGTGLGQDYTVAKTWASKAAAQGDAWAMRILGLIYLNGLGVEADRFKAANYFKRAANAGEMNAQYNLAVLEYDGTTGKQDYNSALYWYRRSANQGNITAQHNLALMLAQGIGTTEDRVDAYKWFELSGSGDAVAATHEMQSLVPRMSKSEVAEAQRRAEMWHASLEWIP